METLNDQNPKPEANKTYHLFKSKTFLIVVIILVELVLLVGVFDLGMKVAFRKARFTYSWMNNYPANFGMPGGRFMDHNPGDHEFINDSGVSGQIVSIKDNLITIKGTDNNEKTISVSAGTAIRKGFTDIKLTDLKAGDKVVIIGEDDDKGQIEAKLIRVLNP